MGRWVTSKGRRIYIPDEGEENPFKEGFKKKKEIQDIAESHNKKVWNGGARNKELYDEADKFAESHNFNKEKTRDAAFAAFNEKWVDSVKRKQEGKDPIDKEEQTKEKQIAENKKQADERNDKIKPYYVDQETQILDKKMSSRGKMIYAKSEEEALSQYKKEYPKGNPRIKESKYPEHIKRARELNKKQSRMDKGDWEERVDSLYAKYSKKFSVEPNSWLQYGEEGKAAYRQYKEAVNKVEPNKRKQHKYFRDRREF